MDTAMKTHLWKVLVCLSLLVTHRDAVHPSSKCDQGDAACGWLKTVPDAPQSCQQEDTECLLHQAWLRRQQAAVHCGARDILCRLREAWGLFRPVVCDSREADCRQRLQLGNRPPMLEECDASVGDCESKQMLDKRQHLVATAERLSSCSCTTARYDVEDLGPKYYPREIPYLRCNRDPCWKPPYHCKNYEYTVFVLRSRNQSEPLNDRIPEELRPRWTFEEKKISVGCVCGLSGRYGRQVPETASLA